MGVYLFGLVRRRVDVVVLYDRLIGRIDVKL